MHRHRSAPSYKALIRQEQKPFLPKIRRTRYPIFNIWRLIKGPCGSRNCRETHMSEHYASLVIWLTVFICLCTILIIASIAPEYDSDLRMLAIPMTIGFLTFFILTSTPAWILHGNELREERKHLLKQHEALGALLGSALQQAIAQQRAKTTRGSTLLLRQSTLLLVKSLIGSPKRPIMRPTKPDEPGSYREPPGGVRISVTHEFNDNLEQAQLHANLFIEHNSEQCDRLMDEARAIGSMLDDYTSMQKLTSRGRVAKQASKRIETAIQARVEAFYAELWNLEGEATAMSSKIASLLTKKLLLNSTSLPSANENPPAHGRQSS